MYIYICIYIYIYIERERCVCVGAGTALHVRSMHTRACRRRCPNTNKRACFR